MPNPNFPSYPSNAAALGMAPAVVLGMAPAVVLGHLFPSETARYRAWAQEFGESRLWAGIHFRSDIEAGRGEGRGVGAALIDRAKGDGAE